MTAPTIISLGLGVQSTALYYMSSMGQIPRADVAVFADTGGERAATLDYLERVLLPWKEANNGIPIIVMRDRNLEADLLDLKNRPRFASIPAFTRNEDGGTGMLRRQCTNEYKIAQVNKGIRLFHGLKPRQRTPPTVVLIGITTDEIERLFQPEEPWKEHRYPFIGYTVRTIGFERYSDQRMSRQDVIAWYERHGLEVPPKSGCYFCPFQSADSWRRMKREEPGDWSKAIRIDAAIRDASRAGVERPIYLHSSAKPLSEAPLDQPTLFEMECSGNCHT